jgi:hypothetical protein
MGEIRDEYRSLVRNPERNRPIGRPRHRWVDIIIMDLGETGLGGIDLIDLTQFKAQ